MWIIYEEIKDTCVALFNLFIENNASLINLNMFIERYSYQLIDNICDIILNNPKFISEIFYFKFYIINNLNIDFAPKRNL